MNVVSLVPSGTEIVFALGAGNHLKGVSHECNYPSEASKLTVVSNCVFDSSALGSREIDQAVLSHANSGKSIYQIDVGKLRAAEPDVLITQGLCHVCAVNGSDVSEAVKSLDKPPVIISLDPHGIKEVVSDIIKLGQALGKESQAAKVVRDFNSRINAVKEKAQGLGKRTVFCCEWLDPIYCGGHWMSEMVEIAGGTDALSKPGGLSVPIGFKQLVEVDPEVIVLSPCGFTVEKTVGELSSIERNEGWGKLQAVRNNEVYVANGMDYFSRSGPRLVRGIELLAQVVRPEAFGKDYFPNEAVRL